MPADKVIGHTPGPWRADVNCSPMIWAKTKVGDMKVADIRGWGHLTGMGMGALKLAEGDAIAIQAANAHLIASAPELLAALKELLRVDDEWHGSVNSEMSQARSNARAAIEKAEGRP